MSFRKLTARAAIVVFLGGLLSFSIIVFASRDRSTDRQNKKTRSVEAEVITVTPRGFEPAEIVRPRGEFILMIENPNREELDFTLTRETGASVHRVRASREEPNWNELEDLPPGRYVLTENSHPEWSCVITITAN